MYTGRDWRGRLPPFTRETIILSFSLDHSPLCLSKLHVEIFLLGNFPQFLTCFKTIATLPASPQLSRTFISTNKHAAEGREGYRPLRPFFAAGGRSLHVYHTNKENIHFLVLITNESTATEYTVIFFHCSYCTIINFFF